MDSLYFLVSTIIFQRENPLELYEGPVVFVDEKYTVTSR